MGNYLELPTGDKAPEILTAVVEIPGDSTKKHEYDRSLNVFVLHVELLERDRGKVSEMLKKGQESIRVLRRALILCQLDSGQKAAQVGANLGVAPTTVRATVRRYETEGLEAALHEKPRPGKVRALNPVQIKRILAMVCSPPPEGRVRWSVRLIAAEIMRRRLAPPVSRETIRILLKSHNL